MMEQPICDERARYAFTWPGREQSFICEEHSYQLRNVANAIGLPLQLIPLPEESDMTCRQAVPVGEAA